MEPALNRQTAREVHRPGDFRSVSAVFVVHRGPGQRVAVPASGPEQVNQHGLTTSAGLRDAAVAAAWAGASPSSATLGLEVALLPEGALPVPKPMSTYLLNRGPAA